MVMIQRMLLVLLLLSSHAFALRSAVGAFASDDSTVMTEPCCPLCVPARGDTISLGCGCGCGEAEQDNRMPTSPDDVPGVLSTEHWVPDAEPAQTRVFYTAQSNSALLASVFNDASGHTQTNRFLARVGVWLN
jgi:hypothetical protein